MTRRYWQRVGGTLIEEYYLAAAAGTGKRSIDGVIVLGGEHRIANRGEAIDLNGKDIIVVQTKASRLGMNLLGQARYTPDLIREQATPRSIRSVALCAKDCTRLRKYAERDGIEVIIDATTAG